MPAEAYDTVFDAPIVHLGGTGLLAKLDGEASRVLLAEADHIFDQELMRIAADPGPSVRRVLDKARASLRRAHEVVDYKPGTAASLARQVLIDLDQLESARQSALGTG